MPHAPVEAKKGVKSLKKKVTCVVFLGDGVEHWPRHIIRRFIQDWKRNVKNAVEVSSTKYYV
jgi:hypothetical protein